MIYLVALAPLSIVAATALLTPNLAPRYSLFGVRVSPEFRDSPAARQAIRAFRFTVLAGFLLAVFVLAGFIAARTPASALSMVAPLFLSIALTMSAWFWQYRLIKPFAVRSTEQFAVVELSADADRLPASVWLAIIPPLLLLLSALLLSTNWNRIPAHFPVHWGIDGEPNRWADRTFRGVYGPLLFAALLDAWLAILMFSLWHGVRRSKYRAPTLHALLATQLLITGFFCLMALSPVWKLSSGWEAAILATSMAGFLAFLISYAMRVNALPGDGGDGTPESAWHGGMLYFNRKDPAIATPRRDGFGYTINLANYQAWLLTLAPFAIIAVAAVWLL